MTIEATSREMVYEMATRDLSLLRGNCLYCQFSLTSIVLSHNWRAECDWRPSEGKANAHLLDVTVPRIESARVAADLNGHQCLGNQGSPGCLVR
jgi:hypothetical protein